MPILKNIKVNTSERVGIPILLNQTIQVITQIRPDLKKHCSFLKKNAIPERLSNIAIDSFLKESKKKHDIDMDSQSENSDN